MALSIALLPALLGVMAAAFTLKSFELWVSLSLFAIGAWISTACLILYTTLIANQVTKVPFPGITSYISIVTLLFFFGELLFFESSLELVWLIIYLASELIRSRSISKRWLKKENRKDGFFDMALLMWIVLFPLAGIWNLKNRAAGLKEIK